MNLNWNIGMDKNRWSLVCLNLYNLFRQWWLLFSITNNFLSLPWTNWWKEVHLQSLAKNIPLMKAAASQNITLIVWSLIFIFNLSHDNINKSFHYKVLCDCLHWENDSLIDFANLYRNNINKFLIPSRCYDCLHQEKAYRPNSIIALVMLNN